MCPPTIHKQPKIIAVTGTNGKTSTTHFIARLLKKINIPSAVIGTVGNGPIDDLTPSQLTTPGNAELQVLLNDFSHKNIDIITLEASSHGLAQNRLKNTDIYMGIFTNLTRDHLDYHKNIKHYTSAKFKLFTEFNLHHAIFNIDDKTGLDFSKKMAVLKPQTKITTLSLLSHQADIYLDSIIIHETGMRATVHTPWGTGLLETTLLGQFNLYNLLSAIAALGNLNIPLQTLLIHIPALLPIPGRIEFINGQIHQKANVIIDYSHTPDSLQKALLALREHYKKNIWCIMGCGGDRDKGKRPLMGRIGEKLSDFLMITSDNPRTENPLEIINDILSGLKHPENTQKIMIEPDRGQAIKKALQYAKMGDIILVAGKGHEEYQEINHIKFPFSDLKTITENLHEL